MDVYLFSAISGLILLIVPIMFLMWGLAANRIGRLPFRSTREKLRKSAGRSLVFVWLALFDQPVVCGTGGRDAGPVRLGVCPGNGRCLSCRRAPYAPGCDLLHGACAVAPVPGSAGPDGSRRRGGAGSGRRTAVASGTGGLRRGGPFHLSDQLFFPSSPGFRSGSSCFGRVFWAWGHGCGSVNAAGTVRAGRRSPLRPGFA